MITGYIFDGNSDYATYCTSCANKMIKDGIISPDCLTSIDSKDTLGYLVLCRSCLAEVYTQDVVLPDLYEAQHSEPIVIGYKQYRQDSPNRSFCPRCVTAEYVTQKNLSPILSTQKFGYFILCNICADEIYRPDHLLDSSRLGA